MTRLHKMLFSLALVAAAGLVSVSQARAQTVLSPETSAAIAAGKPAPPPVTGLEVRQGSGGVSYISGGAGDSARSQLEARRKEFPFKLVLSAGSGEYIVADRVVLRTKSGNAVVEAAELGPWVLISGPAGSYTLEVVYNGETKRQTVMLGKERKQVNLRFKG